MSKAKDFFAAILVAFTSALPAKAVETEIQIKVLSPLQFGVISAGEGSSTSITLDPQSGLLSSENDAKRLSGRPSPMILHVIGSPHCLFDVLTPSAVTLHGSTGTTRVTEITVSGARRFDQYGEAEVRVGGKFVFQAAGRASPQVGEITVSIEYAPTPIQPRQCTSGASK